MNKRESDETIPNQFTLRIDKNSYKALIIYLQRSRQKLIRRMQMKRIDIVFGDISFDNRAMQ